MKAQFTKRDMKLAKKLAWRLGGGSQLNDACPMIAYLINLHVRAFHKRHARKNICVRKSKAARDILSDGGVL